MDHKKTLQELNSRLVAYVEKVRKLQRTTDAIDSMPKQGFELSHYRVVLTPTVSLIIAVSSPSPSSRRSSRRNSPTGRASRMSRRPRLPSWRSTWATPARRRSSSKWSMMTIPVPVQDWYHHLIVSFDKLESCGGSESEIVLWGYNRWVPFRCDINYELSSNKYIVNVGPRPETAPGPHLCNSLTFLAGSTTNWVFWGRETLTSQTWRPRSMGLCPSWTSSRMRKGSWWTMKL